MQITRYVFGVRGGDEHLIVELPSDLSDDQVARIRMAVHMEVYGDPYATMKQCNQFFATEEEAREHGYWPKREVK